MNHNFTKPNKTLIKKATILDIHKMAATTNFNDVVENARLARENALLGQYDTSLVYYQVKVVNDLSSRRRLRGL